MSGKKISRARPASSTCKEAAGGKASGGSQPFAIIAGAWRAKPATETRIENRLLFITAVIAVVSVWAVIVIDGLVM